MDEPPRLDDLIALARTTAASDDPIDELAAAAGLKSELDELTDALLGHFVDQARRAGRSWSQIGEALGVTKQAAQQRHTSTESAFRRMLLRLLPEGISAKGAVGARFTPRAKTCVAAAETTAVELRHGWIGTEHLLLGLYAEPEAVAALVLVEAGVERAGVEAAVVDVLGRGTEPVTGHVLFTPRAKAVLERTLREAVQLGHNYLGTEHVLLALLAHGEGVAHEVLAARGMTYDVARSAVVRRLAAG